MTREEAIEWLDDIKNITENWSQEVAIDMAIEALKASTDLISRQAAIELIKNYCENGCDIAEDNWCPSCQREQFIELLKALPSAEPKTGKWIRGSYIGGPEYRRCNQCFAEIEEIFFGFEYDVNYCPNCGAQMKGADE